MNRKKLLSVILSAAMLMGSVSIPAAAAEKQWKDGTYTGSATVNPDEDEDFDAYGIEMKVTVSGGKISDVALSGELSDEDNEDYFSKALDGTKKKK